MKLIYVSFAEVAAKLATEGPFKHELAKRRIRARVGKEWAFDTQGAEFVWEHPYCEHPPPC